jgi:opacity protein-like surface antigen
VLWFSTDTTQWSAPELAGMLGRTEWIFYSIAGIVIWIVGPYCRYCRGAGLLKNESTIYRLRSYPVNKSPLLCGAFLCVMFILSIPSAIAQSNPLIFEPDHGRFQIGAGYQAQHYNVLGETFHTHGFNTDVSMHIFDWITGASMRVAVAGEATAAFGFGHLNTNPNQSVKSLFVGGGPHVSIQSESFVEPWVHVLPGWQHYRFAQSNLVGSNSAFGFMAGGGLDFKVAPRVYLRMQGDYIGTHFQSDEQSNFSVGAGLMFYF